MRAGKITKIRRNSRASSEASHLKDTLPEWLGKWHGPVSDTNKQKKRDFTNSSGMEISPLYTPLDLEEQEYMRELGLPGEYPYTRGIHPTMYRGKPWTMRQFAGFGSAKDTNQRCHYLLKAGQTGLSIAFDMPTLMGRDSNDPRSKGEVGVCGVAVDTLNDMETIFNGIPLDRVTTSMTINGPAMVLLSMYAAVAEKQGVDLEKVGGTIQNDILKEYIAQKEWLFPPRPSMRIITDMIAFCKEGMPRFNTISISGYHIREAGAIAVEELAFTIADGIAYVQAGIERGLDVDSFSQRLSFFFNAHIDFFEEIAKYRAARRIWARIMKERFKAKDPRSWLLRFHTQTAGVSLTAQQPVNNVVRVTLQALSAVLGGTQSLHTNSMDEVLALPSVEAATVALRTQQIIAEESGVTNTIDPLGGSYFIESLTNRMESEALAIIGKIDSMGGMIKAIEDGYPMRAISDSAYKYQKQIDSREKKVVGVNSYTSPEKTNIPILKIDEEVERKQVENLEKNRISRDEEACARAISRLKEAASSTENLMPLIIECVKSYATIGEICSTLKQVFGEYQEQPVF